MLNMMLIFALNLEKMIAIVTLDTGSEVSIFPENVVDPSLIEDSNKALRAANGTEIPILLAKLHYCSRLVSTISRRQDWSHLMYKNQC